MAQFMRWSAQLRIDSDVLNKVPQDEMHQGQMPFAYNVACPADPQGR